MVLVYRTPCRPGDLIAQSSRIDAPAAAQKRTRTSKPKVRTGCVTCKIRRVKCDETKPACARCTTTGRTCDGYDSSPPPRKSRRKQAVLRKPSESVYGVQALRLLAANIEGTDQERLYFHRYREIAEVGLAFHSSRDQSSFWRRLLPRLGHDDTAIRHALIALGSSLQSLKLQNQARECHEHNNAGWLDGYQVERLELFTIRHYNEAIGHLQRHVMSPLVPESIEMTLLCCLVFISIEIAQGNQTAIIAHITNGLQIIATLPTELLRFSGIAGDYGTDDEASVRAHGFSLAHISRSDWRQLLDFFLSLEYGLSTYGIEQRSKPFPSLTRRLLSITPIGAEVIKRSKITSVDEVHDIKTVLSFQTSTRSRETHTHKGDSEWWSDVTQKRQQLLLLSQIHQARQLCEEFLTGPNGPSEADQAGYISLLHDTMIIRALQIITVSMPYNYTRLEIAVMFEKEFLDILAASEKIVCILGQSDKLSDIMLDNGLLLAMHVLSTTSMAPSSRRRVLDVVRFLKGKRETIYNGADMYEMLGDYGIGSHGLVFDNIVEGSDTCRFLEERVGPNLSGDGMDTLRELLAAMKLERLGTKHL